MGSKGKKQSSQVKEKWKYILKLTTLYLLCKVRFRVGASLQGGRSLEQTLTLYRKLGQKQGVGTILRVGAVFVVPYQTTHQSMAQDKQIKAPNGKKISKVFI